MNLPDHSSIVALANTFSWFSINQTSPFAILSPPSHSRVLNPIDTKVLQNLISVTADEVCCVVLRALYASHLTYTQYILV